MSAEFAQLLAEGNIDAVVGAWAKLFPGAELPADRRQGEVAMHYARTLASAVPLDKRAWSHRWLVDHGWPSGLPDELKPRAERLYPKAAEAVAVASARRQPYTAPVRAVMEEQIKDAYATRRILRLAAPERAAIVKGRMLEARAKERKALGV